MIPLRTLYLCYFGLREPLVQTQVLPYLRQMKRDQHGGEIEVNLLTFEPNQRRAWSPQETQAWRDQLRADGIRWFSLPYHKRPSALVTLYDIAAGARAATRCVRGGVDVLHARSHVAMAMGLLAQRFTNCRLVFDLRGLLAEEYADAGIWSESSLPFRMVKRLETIGVQRADQVVVLTERMRKWLIEQGLTSADKIEVIPCCVDFSRFANLVRSEARSKAECRLARFEVVYAGSVTGLYLLEEMGRFFLALRSKKPNAFLRVLTTSPVEQAAESLRRVGLNQSDFWVGSVRPDEVPQYLRCARVGLSFRKPTFSQIAASPTKIPEYLAAGLPVVCNSGIGDMDDLIESSEVGLIVRAFDSAVYAEAADKVLALTADPNLPARCVGAARQHFDLESVGGARYRRLYRRLMEGASR